MWTINVDKSVDKCLKKIPEPDRSRINQAIDDLEVKPETLDIKPLVGREGYRLRIRGWRLLIDIDEVEKTIFVYTLSSRGDVYKK